MSDATTSRLRRPFSSPWSTALAVACVLVLLLAAGLWWVFSGNERRIDAYFSSAVGLYPGGDVRVLGVPVGTIDSVTPGAGGVRVALSVQRDVRVPANAKAVLVSPSVVSDRYVQLAPVYRGGPTMDDGAVIPQQRTATPAEVDEVYRSLNKLTTALGPHGANSQGALSQLLNTGAANLKGNGQALADSLRNLGEAGTTLSGNSKQLFGTVDQLQRFTSMLAGNDAQVRRFNTQVQEVSGFLADERGDLGAAMAELATALGRVESFVRDNRAHLKSNVDQLNGVARVLVKQKAALSEALTNAPLALGNLNNAYNGSSGTLDTRADLNELSQPPLVSVCKLLDQGNPVNLPLGLTDVCKRLQPVIDGVAPLPTPAQALSAVQQGKLPPLPLPLTTQDGIQAPLPGGGP